MALQQVLSLDQSLFDKYDDNDHADGYNCLGAIAAYGAQNVKS